jgi:hypothetical protein
MFITISSNRIEAIPRSPIHARNSFALRLKPVSIMFFLGFLGQKNFPLDLQIFHVCFDSILEVTKDWVFD